MVEAPRPPQRKALATLRLTPMIASDVAAVVQIEQQSNPEPWSGAAFLEEMARPHSRQMVARITVHGTEVVAGFICFWLVADELQILNLAVHPDHRRKGIGRALLLLSLRKGSENHSRRAVLEVRSSNRVAQDLYRSVGFRKVGERAKYYSEEGAGEKKLEAAVLMELDMTTKSIF